jgi:hypothetical protein
MIGKTLANYEITSQIGKGGMGEVYQAKDKKLGRNVAIKVLPEEFARDADRVARFQREAKLLASLNHPNIAAIYGLEESEDTNFLVMAVNVETRPTFIPGPTEVLFQGPYFRGPGNPWDIHPDGKRFLMMKPAATAEGKSSAALLQQIIVIVNWFEELKKLAPAD